MFAGLQRQKRGNPLTQRLDLPRGKPRNGSPPAGYLINVRVFDQSTGATYNVGTDYVTKGDQYIQSVSYQIPQLTKFVNADQFGRVTKVAGNWYFPSGDSQPGATVQWSCNVSKVTMTYWVTSFSTGSGTGGNTSGTIDLGGSGSKIINFTIRYHSNYPSGTNYTATKKYTVKNFVTPCTISSDKFLTYGDCGFGGFTPRATDKTWYTSTACTNTVNLVSATNGAVFDLYAGWEPAPAPVETFTLTYKDGNKTYRTLSGFSSGDDVLLMGSPEDKDGYTFEGWSETSGATTAQYKGGEVFKITKNTVLYAVWKENAPAHTVQQNGSGSLNVIKTFSGATKPDTFAMTYQITNGATSGTVGNGSLVFNEIVPGTGIYMATVSYPVWSFTGEWTDAEKAQYNSVITLTEVGAEVADMDLTITATAGEVNNAAKTIIYTVGAQVSAAGNLNVTNTYTPASVTPNTPKLTSIKKERLTSAPAGVDVTGVNLRPTPTLGSANSVTLLYSITVEGDEDANYNVTDVGAVRVGGAPLSGTIDGGKVAVIYVTKTYNFDEIAEGPVQNTAYVKAGLNTDPIPDVTPDEEKGTPSNTVFTQIVGRTVTVKNPTEPGSDLISNCTVTVTNKTGLTLTSIDVTDTMDKGMSIILGQNGTPEFTIKLYSKDDIESTPSVSVRTEDEGQTVIWSVSDTIEPGARIVLEYSVKGGKTPEGVALDNHAATTVTGIQTSGERSISTVDAVDDFIDLEDLSSEDVCTINFPGVIESEVE